MIKSEKGEGYKIKATTSSEICSTDVSRYLDTSSSYVFAIGNIDSYEVVEGKLTLPIETFFHEINEFKTREELYLKALNNLLKQKNYLNLMYELSNEFISEEEFSNELEDNEDKYLIKINETFNPEKLRALKTILYKLKAEILSSEISEIFSFDIEDQKKHLNFKEFYEISNK